jgi:ornithine carbamoyltransferase
MDFTIASPRDFRIPDLVWDEAKRRAVDNESAINWVEAPEEAVGGVDVVYTDVWISMGDENEASERRKIFSRYQISEDLVKGAKSDFIFMHDMPAHRGEEITDGMLDHPNSVVFDQAENRLHAQKAILAQLFEG